MCCTLQVIPTTLPAPVSPTAVGLVSPAGVGPLGRTRRGSDRDVVRPGVVSLPHGWGHDRPGSRLRVAAERAGVNSNVLTDDAALDPLSGTSVLNGSWSRSLPVPHAAGVNIVVVEARSSLAGVVEVTCRPSPPTRVP
ncbi:MAG: molybdopterin dinucleotide binding domain-containing protein [Ilumatobacteraceae bacterium]